MICNANDKDFSASVEMTVMLLHKEIGKYEYFSGCSFSQDKQSTKRLIRLEPLIKCKPQEV